MKTALDTMMLPSDFEASRDGSTKQLFKCDGRAEARVTPPLLELSDQRNVWAWLGGRQVLLRFGDRFRARIEAFTGAFTLFLVILLAMVLLALLLLEPEALSMQLLLTTVYLIGFLFVRAKRPEPAARTRTPHAATHTRTALRPP